MDLNTHLKLGWYALHDACFKGNTSVISKLVNYAKENGKNLIELETSDDYKTTPLIIAALGSQLQVIDFLISNGANINATIQVQENRINLGIVEVAIIRKDINLLLYLYQKEIPNVCKKLRALMISETIEDKSREACVQVVEMFSHKYFKLKEESKKAVKDGLLVQTNVIPITLMEQMAVEIVTHFEFGRCLASLLELCYENVNCLISFVQIFSHVFEIAEIRSQFCNENGLDIILKYIEVHQTVLNKQIRLLKIKKKIIGKSRSSFDSDSDEESNETNIIHANIEIEAKCVCIGKIIAVFSSYNDCLEILNNIDFKHSEKLISYIWSLFECNSIQVDQQISFTGQDTQISKELKNPFSLVEKSDPETPLKVNQSVQFEQYIQAYLIFLGNVTHNNDVSKRLFNKMNLIENILKYWNHLSKINPSDSINTKSPYAFDPVSSDLIKNIKLTVIETLGKTLNRNDKLKRGYLYSYKQIDNDDLTEKKTVANKYVSADWFIQECINWLEASSVLGREFQFKVLKFLQLITEADPVMQNIVVPMVDDRIQSSIIICLKSLMKKSVPEVLRHLALKTLWTLSGEKNEFQEYHDRKCTINRLINPEDFIDLLSSTDNDVVVMCLEALLSILNTPSLRDSRTKEIVNKQDELAKIHITPAILRLLESPASSEEIHLVSLRILQSLCVSYGYRQNNENQFLILKHGGLVILLDFTKKHRTSKFFECQVYYTLSMLCLGNMNLRNEVFAQIDSNKIIKAMRDLLISPVLIQNETLKSNEILNEDIESITIKVTAGLILCGFCYHNEDFIKKMIQSFEKIDMEVFKSILDMQNHLIRKAVFINDKKSHFLIQRTKCSLSYLIVALSRYIKNFKEDPRAIGIKIMIDMLSTMQNSYIRSVVCDYIGRLVCMESSLIDPFICMDVIEILTRCTFNEEKTTPGSLIRGETEKGCAAISLGFFLTTSPDARRRFFKIARKNENVMKIIIDSNKTIHPSLLAEWKHYKYLNG